MVRIFYRAGILALNLLILVMSGCNKCPAEIEISSNLELQELSLPIRSFSTETEITFVDEELNEFLYVLTDSQEGQVKFAPRYMATCENGDSFKPFYFRETISKTYSSEDGSEIKLVLFASSSTLIRSEDDEPTYFDDMFLVELSFPECDAFRSATQFMDENGESRLRTNFPFPLIKHGQVFRDSLFAFYRGGLNRDLHFMMGKGLIAFNHCGRDWVQKND